MKAATESHAEAGDKANDAIRVDGGELRAKAVGEGGNLGFTQRGRIEYAAAGGRICTDFIDNSAGVDTSDHEVNIKILLDKVMESGDMTEKQRNKLLGSMTDEVGTLVLADNYEQNVSLASAERVALGLSHVHESWIRRLEKQGLLDREIEFLPVDEGVRGPAGRRAGAHGARAVGPAGLHEDRARRRAARQRHPGRPLPAWRPVQLLPDARCARPTGARC